MIGRTAKVQAAVEKLTVELLVAAMSGPAANESTPQWLVKHCEEVAGLYHDRLTERIERGDVTVEDLAEAEADMQQFEEDFAGSTGRAD